METNHDNPTPENNVPEFMRERMAEAQAARDKAQEQLGPQSAAALMAERHPAPLTQNGTADVTNVPVSQEVPAQDMQDLAAHMDVREMTDDQRDNKLAELEARLQAVEVTMNNALQNLAEYLEARFAAIPQEAQHVTSDFHADMTRAIAYVKTLMHPSQWEKLGSDTDSETH